MYRSVAPSVRGGLGWSPSQCASLFDILATLDHVQRERDELRAECKRLRRVPVRLLVERDDDCDEWQEIWTTPDDAAAIERGVVFGSGTRGDA